MWRDTLLNNLYEWRRDRCSQLDFYARELKLTI